MKTLPPLRLAPEPWIGMAVGYDPDWQKNVFLPAIDTRAWDKLSKTWWFPRSFEPIVSQMIRERPALGVTDAALQNSRVELYRDKIAGAADPTMAADIALLFGMPSPPPQLVDWARAYWVNVFRHYGAPPTTVMQMEEAYARIMARVAAMAPNVQAPQTTLPGQPRGDQG